MKDLHFYTPNQEVRQEIMDLYLGQKEGDFDVDTEMLSYMFTDDTTPAEIEALVESSFFHAAKRSLEEGGEPQLTTEDVYEELAQRRLTDRTEDGRSQEEVETTALHEIGHYIVGREAGLNIPFVTIVPSIRSLGETHYVDENNIADLDDPYAGLSKEYGEQLKDKFTNDFDSFTIKHFIVKQGGESVGHITYVENGEMAAIYNLGTIPDYRRKGIATATLRKTVEKLKERDLDHIFFQTEKGGKNEDFFSTRGFKTKFEAECLIESE